MIKLELRDWNNLQCAIFERCGVILDNDNIEDFVNVAKLISPYKRLARTENLAEYLVDRIIREYDDETI